MEQEAERNGARQRRQPEGQQPEPQDPGQCRNGGHADGRQAEEERRLLGADAAGRRDQCCEGGADEVDRGQVGPARAAARRGHTHPEGEGVQRGDGYGAAEQLYWMLYHARGGRGQIARDAMTRFFFPGVDLHTDKYDLSTSVDVETQALLHFDQQVTVLRKMATDLTSLMRRNSVQTLVVGLGILTGNHAALVLLGVGLALWGCYTVWLIVRNPDELTATENHPSWRHMYLMMMAAQIGFAAAYLV